MKWPDQFKAIMWEAIADAARIRALSLTFRHQIRGVMEWLR